MKGLRYFLQAALCILTLVSLAQTTASAGDKSHGRRAIVVLPGFMGSHLRDRVTKQRVYVDIGSIFSGTPLSLYSQSLGTQASPALETDGVLDYITVFGVRTVDLYGSLIDKLRAIPDADVYPFAYDWRQDAMVGVKDLAKTIKALHKRGYEEIDLVAHSGGGFIVTYYLGYGTQDPASATLDWRGAKEISKVALLGTPFKGAFQFVKYLSRGNDVPMMKHLFNAETMASFPLSYRGVARSARLINLESGKAIKTTINDVSFWKKFGLGLLEPRGLDSYYMERRESFIRRQLKDATIFMDRIGFVSASSDNRPPENLSVLSIVGAGIKTLNTAFVLPESSGGPRLYFDGELAGTGFDESVLFTDGDGIVSSESAALPKALRPNAKIVKLKVGHADLAPNAQVQGLVQDFILK